jgi:alpha-1,2-mannosyltransferase
VLSADGSNSGGGGERVLWSAIAYLQRKKPDVVSMVYSGDYPEASKEEIIAKVFVRSIA